MAGYPVATQRRFTAPEMEERIELLQRRAEVYKAWVSMMDEAMAGDPSARLALVGRRDSLANQAKSNGGAAVKATAQGVAASAWTRDSDVIAWAENHPNHRGLGSVYHEIAEIVERRRAVSERDFLLGEIGRGSRSLDLGVTVVDRAEHATKGPALPHMSVAESNEQMKAEQQRIHPETEERLLVDFLWRMASLPSGKRSSAVDLVLDGSTSRDAIAGIARRVLQGSRILDLGERTLMFRASIEELKRRGDPIIDLALGLVAERQALRQRQKSDYGSSLRLHSRWQRATVEYAGGLVDHDADGTLRVSFGHIQEFRPRDAVWLESRTTVRGIQEKNTGEPPFDAPEWLLAGIATSAQSRWADRELDAVPVNFLADGDTSAGSSGSPILNGKGELIGVNFDRIWESIANDLAYDPKSTRSIGVDIRYMCWLLEAQYGRSATAALLLEMGAAPRR